MSDFYIGTIKLASFNYAPKGMLPCDGSQLQITQYQALYSVIGVQFGGDARTVFNLPDFRGRTMVGFGQNVWGLGTNSYLQVGNKGGAQTVTLTANNLPIHTHFGSFQLTSSSTPGSNIPTNAYFAPQASGNPSGPVYNNAPTPNNYSGAPEVTIGTAGGGAINIMNPFLGLNYVIVNIGIYPSRG